MAVYKLLSWNVNGIRAIEKKGFLDWLKKEDPFFLGVQEARISREQISDSLVSPHGFSSFWNFSERKGYSGVVSYCREKPRDFFFSIGRPQFDGEGRIAVTEFPEFYVINTYFPNGRSREERLTYKLDFTREHLGFLSELKRVKKKPLVVCGDFNTAHKEIDLARPKENEKVSGFLPQERALIDDYIRSGFVDTFRVFNHEPGCYTWWDMKTKARERNVGWRLDYFFIDRELQPRLKDAFIMKDVMGSDHSPVGIVLEFP